MDLILFSLISLLGLAGFLIAAFIYRKKKLKQKLVCPMRADCDTVIHSDYSRIFGIPVEILGMIYYAFIGLTYSLISISNLWTVPIAYFLFAVSLFSVIFSIYLISIQMFVIKNWCSWCMYSAGITILILIFSYLHLNIY